MLAIQPGFRVFGHAACLAVNAEGPANPGIPSGPGIPSSSFPSDFYPAVRDGLSLARMTELLGRGVDVHSGPVDGALHHASERGHDGVIQALLECGADITSTDIWQSSALHLTSEYGREGIVHTLLQFEADFNSRDGGGQNALHFASEHRHESVIRALLNCGVDGNTRNRDGQSALQLPTKFDRREVIQVLFKYGAWQDIDDTYGRPSVKTGRRFR